jgi:hypothetical protein
MCTTPALVPFSEGTLYQLFSHIGFNGYNAVGMDNACYGPMLQVRTMLDPLCGCG